MMIITIISTVIIIIYNCLFRMTIKILERVNKVLKIRNTNYNNKLMM